MPIRHNFQLLKYQLFDIQDFKATLDNFHISAETKSPVIKTGATTVQKEKKRSTKIII